MKDESREMRTKWGKHRTEVKREADQNEGSQPRLTATFMHFHGRCSVSLNLEETMG